jgi:ABC-type lipoprotein release transport system permease subunit
MPIALRFLRRMGVCATDPLVFVATAMLLALVVLAAAWIPARWAARVEPGIALRSG